MATLTQIDVMQEGVLFGLPMPLTFRPPVSMTDEELIAFSRRNRPFQIERNAKGEIEIMTPVGGKGGRFESYLIRELDLWTESHSGASFSSNAGFSLPDGSMRSADAAWVSEERWNSLSDNEQTSFPPLCPEFIIELASVSDSRTRLEAKMEMWMANGAQLAWMIDPFAVTLSIYRPGAGVEVLERPEVVEAGEPVAGFRLEMTRLWAK